MLVLPADWVSSALSSIVCVCMCVCASVSAYHFIMDCLADELNLLGITDYCYYILIG